MRRFLIMAVACLMLSCSCREMTESRLPRPAATPSQRGTNRVAASVTGCLSGSDSVKVFLKVSRVIDGDTFEGRMTVNTKEAYNPGVNPWASTPRSTASSSAVRALPGITWSMTATSATLSWKLRRSRMVVVSGAMTEPFPRGNGEG